MSEKTLVSDVYKMIDYLESCRYSKLGGHFNFLVADSSVDSVLLKAVPDTRTPNPDNLIAIMTWAGFIFDYKTQDNNPNYDFIVSCDFKITDRLSNHYELIYEELVI